MNKSLNKSIRTKTKKFFGHFFGRGFSKLGGIFVAYHPDSHNTFDVHPEFERLFPKFIAHNRRNNAGDITRLWSFILNIKQVINEQIEGSFAELGVWRGNTAAILSDFAIGNGREVFLFDTYSGFADGDLTEIDVDKAAAMFNNTSLEMARKVVGCNDKRCHLVKGHFPESITPEIEEKTFAVISLDCDLYKPTKAGLEFFYPRMSRGGIFFIHDYSSHVWDGAKMAVDEFCATTGEFVVLMPDKSGSAFLRKTRS
ncbi:MAG: TylF/MycF/NovP-related O-methyltransferase [Burkholderiales bacterium]|nr:hypothetical protein [Ferrovum sp.]